RQRPSAANDAYSCCDVVVVSFPVVAHSLVGYIAAAISVDDRLLAKLQLQSALTKGIELASPGGDGRWRVLAQGSERAGMTAGLMAHGAELPLQPRTARIGGREFVG